MGHYLGQIYVCYETLDLIVRFLTREISAAFTRFFLMTVEKVLVNTADISHLKLCRTNLW